MKTIQTQVKGDQWKQDAMTGHTLIEMMFSISILVVVMMALTSANLLGMREAQLLESKCGASDSTRRTLQQLTTDIRSAKMWSLGNMSGTNYVANANGGQQIGTALQLCQTTNGSQYTLYYFDLSDTNNSNGKLCRTASTNWSPVVLASNLINTLYFTSENLNGQIQTSEGTSKSYKNVIHTTLQFCLFQYPLTPVGSNCLYDSYQMDLRATPHLPE